MHALLQSRLARASLAPLRVLVLAALVLALVLPASVYAGSTSPAGTPAVPRAAGRGLASSALPAGLRAALARDLGRAQPAGVAGAAPTFLPLTQQQPLPDPRATDGDTFGSSVALSGDGTTALISVGGANDQDAVYVYIRANGTWQEQTEIPAVHDSGGGFGASLALSGDGNTALIGASDEMGTGTAYIFTRSGSTWSLRQELTAVHPVANGNFGYSVALSGDGTTALIGADNRFNRMIGAHNKDAAYVFTSAGGTWKEQRELTAVHPAANGTFGNSVALSGDGTTALIGAPGTAAYVFTQTGGAWKVQRELTAVHPAAHDTFGSSVALSGDGNTALIGASAETAAYVFTRAGGAWKVQRELTAVHPAANGTFGRAVALSGDGTAAVVGAPGTTVGAKATTGAAYAYTRSGGTWTQRQELTAVHPAAGNDFGNSVALSGDGTAALVGADNEMVAGSGFVGAAYAFTGSGTPAVATGTPTATATAPVTGPAAATGTTTATASPATATTTGPPAASATPTATASPSAPTTTGTPTATATVPVTGPAVATGTPTATASPSAPSNPTAAYFAEGYTGTAAGNGRATFTETLNLLNPGTTPAPVSITYYVQGASAPMTIARTVAGTSVLRESVNSDVGADKVVAAQVTSPQRVYVTRTMTRTDPNGTRLDGSATLPVAAPATTWGFPEGYTGSTFQEYLTILNPNSSSAHVSILLAPQADTAAGAKTLTLTVPALSRSTANIRSLNATGSAKSVGMLISSDQPIVPERVLYFGDGAGSGKFGATVSSGIAAPATHLYLAYGSSGGLATGGTPQATGNQAFITLLNPTIGGATVQVTATFFGADGQQLGTPQLVSVAPGTRQTIVVNPVLGAAAVTPYSAVLNATGPIEAEAAQYYGGSPNIGTHPGVAFPLQTAGSSSVVMSNLETSLLDGTALQRTVYLYNPGAAAVQVAATYYGGNGATAQEQRTVCRPMG